MQKNNHEIEKNKFIVMDTHFLTLPQNSKTS